MADTGAVACCGDGLLLDIGVTIFDAEFEFEGVFDASETFEADVRGVFGDDNELRAT
jgi:hypothetical protein